MSETDNFLANYLLDPGGDRAALIGALAALGLIRVDADQGLDPAAQEIARGNIGLDQAGLIAQINKVVEFLPNDPDLIPWGLWMNGQALNFKPKP